jgi:hypothetical protein
VSRWSFTKNACQSSTVLLPIFKIIMYDHKHEMGSIVDIFKTYYKFLQMFGMYKYEQDSIVTQCANHSIFSHDLYERKCLYKKLLFWD